MLKEFTALFTNEDIAGDFVRIGNEFFLMDSDIKRVISQIKVKPCFAGIYLGCERGRAFAPSLFLLKKLLFLTNKKICVEPKGEWMFICGKDIFGKSIIKTNDYRIGELVLVENAHGDCLGYGRVVAELNEKGKVIEHVFDIGDFLRRER